MGYCKWWRFAVRQNIDWRSTHRGLGLKVSGQDQDQEQTSCLSANSLLLMLLMWLLDGDRRAVFLGKYEILV